MGAFAPGPPPRPSAEEESMTPPPDMEGMEGEAGAAPPMDSFAPTQGFDGGAMETVPPTGMDPSGGAAEQNEGILSMFQDIEGGIRGSTDFLMTLAKQFPGAAEPIRIVLEALQAAESGLLNIIQAVAVESAQPTPAAPRSAF